jgi:hypothetical protein
MARQDKVSYELNESEQRDLVTLIRRGQAAAGEVSIYTV